MSNITTALIEFLLQLLRDADLLNEYTADPDGVLAKAGLTGVTPAHIDAAVPVILDTPGVCPAPAAAAPAAPVAAQPIDRGHHDGGSGGHHGGGHHGGDVNYNLDVTNNHLVEKTFVYEKTVLIEKTVVAQPIVVEKTVIVDNSTVIHEKITSITNSYTYVDDRDTLIDQSVTQQIWAEGDVTQYFENQAVVASGDGAIASGADTSSSGNEIDATIENTTTTISDSGNQTEITTEDSFNSEVEVEDSFNVDSSGNAAVVVAAEQPAAIGLDPVGGALSVGESAGFDEFVEGVDDPNT